MSELHEQYDDVAPEVETEEPYDSGNRRHVQKKAKVTKLRENHDRMVLRQIMGSREGRAWMNHMLLSANVSVAAANPFSQNPYEMAKACGRMELGQELLVAVVAAAPERYLEMLKEAEDGE